MLSEELFHRTVDFEAVFFVTKPMAFVVLDHVGNLNASLFEGGDNLIRFRDFHARIIGPLSNHEWRFDLICMEDG